MSASFKPATAGFLVPQNMPTPSMAMPDAGLPVDMTAVLIRPPGMRVGIGQPQRCTQPQNNS